MGNAEKGAFGGLGGVAPSLRAGVDGVAPHSTVIPAYAGIQYAAAFRFYHCGLWDTRSPLSRGRRLNVCLHSRGALRPSFESNSYALPRFRGRRECRMRAAPAISCAMCTESARMSIQGSGEHPTFPAQWLYGLLRALPGDRLFCHRRLRASVPLDPMRYRSA
jgi:hypothetical protein